MSTIVLDVKETAWPLDGSEQPPLWKWAGGKRWLAPRLTELINMWIQPAGCYYEPFVGAGAVALAYAALEGPPPRMVLSDLCVPLGGLWSWIQNDPQRLFRALSPGWRNEEGFYYALRENFNKCHYDHRDPTPSARFLWLNATGFNGMYRENAEGKLNIPWGKRARISLPSLEDLVRVSALLQQTEVRIGVDFEDGLEGCGSGDACFADPPYDVQDDGSESPAFTTYLKGGFGPDQQDRLARKLNALRVAGANVITTNADTKLVRELYPDRYWHLEPVSERRSIAASAEKRVDAACLVITSKTRR